MVWRIVQIAYLLGDNYIMILNCWISFRHLSQSAAAAPAESVRQQAATDNFKKANRPHRASQPPTQKWKF
jgi:hypothetical protein